jgi:Zn-dependent protease
VYWSTHGWPLALGLVALAVYAITRVPVWLAIAELNGYVNLFNLIPVWQLDGSRGFHALSRWERWVVVAVIALAFLLTGQKLLIIVGAVAVWRAVQREVGPGSGRVLATFVVLLGALAWMAAGVG